MSGNFQSRASQQGREFEDAVVLLLKCKGWTIDGRRIKVAGEEIDIVATNSDGVQWWIECKGSWESKARNFGCRRTDTAKKAMAVAAILAELLDDERRPYMLVTSHLPKPGTSADRVLRLALAKGWFQKLDTLAFGSDAEAEYDDTDEEEAA